MGEQNRGHQSGRTSAAGPGPATLEGVTAAWQEASDALRDSERRYRELVEYSLGLICTHDLTGNILSINPAAANLLAISPKTGSATTFGTFSRRTRDTCSMTTCGAFRPTDTMPV